MRIQKCDFCEKVLNQKMDSYYSIQSISFHNPTDKTVSVVLDNEKEHKNLESWVNYCDLDFCETCFYKLKIKKFI